MDSMLNEKSKEISTICEGRNEAEYSRTLERFEPIDCNGLYLVYDGDGVAGDKITVQDVSALWSAAQIRP